MRTRSSLLLLAGLALASPACIGTYEPDVGELQASPCSNEDTDPSQDVSFREDIVPRVLTSSDVNCLQCHAPDAPTPLGFEVAGLDLSTYESAARGGVNSDGIAIIPGQPCQSIMFQKVSAGPPFGARMPVSGPPFLSEQQLQLVHDWIAEGAKNN